LSRTFITRNTKISVTVSAELREVVHGLQQGAPYFQILVRCHGTHVLSVISLEPISCWERNSGRQMCKYHFTQRRVSCSRMQRRVMRPHSTDLSEGTCLSTLQPYSRFGCVFSPLSHISPLNRTSV